jgi:hypothetical protein
MDELVQMGIYGNRDFSLKKVSPIYIKYEKVCQKYQKFIKKYLPNVAFFCYIFSGLQQKIFPSLYI